MYILATLDYTFTRILNMGVLSRFCHNTKQFLLVENVYTSIFLILSTELGIRCMYLLKRETKVQITK